MCSGCVFVFGSCVFVVCVLCVLVIFGSFCLCGVCCVCVRALFVCDLETSRMGAPYIYYIYIYIYDISRLRVKRLFV